MFGTFFCMAFLTPLFRALNLLSRLRPRYRLAPRRMRRGIDAPGKRRSRRAACFQRRFGGANFMRALVA